MAKLQSETDGAGDTAPLAESKTKQSSSSAKSKPVEMCRVRLLDGTEIEVEVLKNAKGQELFDKVCEHLELSERDYFSCSYLDENSIRFWLHHDKTISSQIKKKHWSFSFEVKFYPVEPATLHEDLTKYLLFLQLRIDILMNKLPCSFVTHQLLGSYIVQSDLGDYDVDEHGAGFGYIREIQFAPQQSDELLEKIANLHVLHRGQSPSEAEASYLDNAKRLAFYGVDLHQGVVRGAQVVEGEVQIGVSAHGLSVYKDRLNIYRWPWQKILEFTYNRSGFLIKIRPKQPREKCQVFKYKLKYDMAKRLWQSAVEHHAFFRLSKPVEPERASFPKVGSKFRYSGRTQQQAQGVPELGHVAPLFSRGAGTRFLASGTGRTGTMDTSTGYSTDRAEKYHYDDQRTNTLDLGSRKKRLGTSMGDVDSGTAGGGGGSSQVPIAGFEDDRNLSPVDPGYDDEDSRVALLSGSRVNYSKAGYCPSAPLSDQGSVSYGTGTYGDNTFNDSTALIPGRATLDGSKIASYNSPERTVTMKQTTVNIVMTTNRNVVEGGDETLPPYQEDHQQNVDLLRPKGQQGNWGATSPAGSVGQGWGPNVSRESKTSSRQYTDSEGNYITEYTLERDGVIEKRIEKRTVITENEEEFDHERALLEAIQSVTEMNQDLSVEKIEIQTSPERR
jgi:erythrocyte membrane protein band 4.1